MLHNIKNNPKSAELLSWNNKFRSVIISKNLLYVRYFSVL